MDEGRKRTLLIAASILVTRKLGQLDAQPTPALDTAIAEAISLAERIMQKIEARTAAPPAQSMTSNAGYPWKGPRIGMYRKGRIYSIGRMPIWLFKSTPPLPGPTKRIHMPNSSTIPDSAPAKSSKSRLLIVDDHDLVRAGLAALLSTQYEICGEAGNGLEAIDKVRRLKPDLVLLDLSMPVLSGTEAAKIIRSLSPQTKIVFITMHDSPTVAELAKTLGADGFISKHSTARGFMKAIRQFSGA